MALEMSVGQSVPVIYFAQHNSSFGLKSIHYLFIHAVNLLGVFHVPSTVSDTRNAPSRNDPALFARKFLILKRFS